jgi:hypothetical protein
MAKTHAGVTDFVLADFLRITSLIVGRIITVHEYHTAPRYGMGPTEANDAVMGSKKTAVSAAIACSLLTNAIIGIGLHVSQEANTDYSDKWYLEFRL